MHETKHYNFTFPSPLWDMVLASETTGAHYDGIEGFYPRDSRWCKGKSQETLQHVYQQIQESRDLLIGKTFVISPGLGYEGEVSELLKFIDQLELAVKDYFDIVPDNATHSRRSIEISIPLQDRRVELQSINGDKLNHVFDASARFLRRRDFLVGVYILLILIVIGFFARHDIRGAYLMSRMLIQSLFK